MMSWSRLSAGKSRIPGCFGLLTKSLIRWKRVFQSATIFHNTLPTFTLHISTIGWKRTKAWSIISDTPMILSSYRITRNGCTIFLSICEDTCMTTWSWKSRRIGKCSRLIRAELIFLGMCFSIRIRGCARPSNNTFAAGWQGWINERSCRPKHNTSRQSHLGGVGASIVIPSI